MRKNNFLKLTLVLAGFIISLLIVVTAIFWIAVTPVFAQGVTPAEPGPFVTLDPNVIWSIMLQFGSMAGVATLIAAIVQVAKWGGAFKDGQSGAWFAGLDLLALVVLVLLHYFAPTVGIEFIDNYAAIIAKIVLFVLAYAMQIWVGSGAVARAQLMRIPVLGASITEGTTLRKE